MHTNRRPRSNILHMQAYVPGEQPGEPGVIKLNTNENPYPPAPGVRKILRGLAGNQLRQYPDPTADALRKTAARVYRISSDEIICGNGSDDILNMIIRAFVTKGDAIHVPAPSYSLYRTLAEVQEARFREIPFPPDYSLPDKLFGTKAKLTLLVNPNAPSGTWIPRTEVARLANSLTGMLVIDEAYVDFTREHCLTLVHRLSNVIVVRTLSKSYSLASMRIGFGIARKRVIRALMKVKDSYNVNLASQRIAVAALQDQAHMRRNVDRITRERAKLTGALEKLGCFVYPSEANFILARVPGGGAAHFFEALKKRRIYVRFLNTRRLKHCLRITIGTPGENAAFVQAFTDILHSRRRPQAPMGGQA